MSENDGVEGVDHLDNSILTLEPLPSVLKQGLPAVAFFGFLSFVSCVALLAYLLYKLVKWNLRPVSAATQVTGTNGQQLADEHLCPQGDRPADLRSALQRLRDEPPNQFLVLILNLLLADIQQALAFLLNVSWVSKNAVRIGNSLCWAQGWFVSTGDLASSVFISAIALHTYLGVVRGYRMPTWAFYLMVIFGWVFNYLMAVIGVIITNNGADDGGFYVRAGAWCWVNAAYQDLRLLLHYLWIFISLGFTSVIYTLIFFHIRKVARESPEKLALASHPHIKQDFSSVVNKHRKGGLASSLSYAKQHTFLLYPFIYVVCTTPLAAGRVAAMTGATPSLAYFCLSGAMIACNGWLDVLLYASTRRSILFSDAPPSQDTGIETFAFMRTEARRFGNVVFVSGGADTGRPSEELNDANHLRGKKKLGSLGKLTRLRSEGGQSEVSLRGVDQSANGSVNSGAAGNGMAIQMETVTSVVVEVENGGSRSGSGRKGSLASDEVSFSSRV